MDELMAPKSVATGNSVSSLPADGVLNGHRPPTVSRTKRAFFFLLACALIAVTVEAASWILIALIPHSAPRRTVDIYNEQSSMIRGFLDTSRQRQLDVHPVLGWCYAANFRSPMQHLNSKALRGTKEYSPVAAPGILRVAAFGSSIVYCSEVDDANAWPALIEAEHPELEVLNYGVGGYGTDQAYLRYLAEGTDFKPAVVLIGFTSDELGRTVNVYRRFIASLGHGPQFKPRYLLGSDGELSLLGSPVRSRADYESLLANPAKITTFGKNDYWYQPSVYENPLYDHSAAVRLICWLSSQLNRRYFDPDRLSDGKTFNEASTAFRIQLALFSKFAEKVRSSSALPVVLFLPEKESVQRGLSGGQKLYDPLLSCLQESGIVYLDAIEAFQNADVGVDVNGWYASGGHYSPLGNKVIAQWLPGKIASIAAGNGKARTD